jgi:hypothetical protein
MQGKLIIGTFLTVALATPSVAAADRQPRPTCAKGEQPQQSHQAQQRQQWAQQQPQQQRSRPQGCPVNRMIPSVVDPTPTFLI